ncbi:MAG TPA: hypothetical protein VK501_25460 [Baekduia sp.]|uniref:hypothetical protein n=1 Tax=Baekduia sp. TaxID=2600305 RepID=UPI002B9C5467|nr:hypothetical protein [Baekduia sp.]HMJ37277.1 hypothetical protein [Baekduia sp.]
MFTTNRVLAAAAVIGALVIAAPVAGASAAPMSGAVAAPMAFPGHGRPWRPGGQWNPGYGRGPGGQWNPGNGRGPGGQWNPGYGRPPGNPWNHGAGVGASGGATIPFGGIGLGGSGRIGLG